VTPSGIVTLLTDFGTRDPFVGVMKGVVLGRFPRAVLVDLTHEIEPQHVAGAAFWIGQAYRYFPAGSVHVAVVDPGVGSARKALVVRADDQLFVGPDNGIFDVVWRRARSFEARELTLSRAGLPPPSRTFHGRDVFAPVAALLASAALAFEATGPAVVPVAGERVPEPSLGSTWASGEVITIDRFGNLITNLEGPWPGVEHARVSVAGHTLPVAGTYSELAPAALAAIFGSFGQLEIACRDGSAARTLAAQRGTAVRVDW
jgi:S-adenosyl-L-methionine hydrolase (adenosine-forming)